MANFQCVTNISEAINVMSKWFEMKCSTTVDLKTVLTFRHLDISLADKLENISITCPIHLCMKDEKEFDDCIGNLLKADGVNTNHIKQLKKFCVELNPKGIQKIHKSHQQATKNMVMKASRPLCMFLEALEIGARNATNAISIQSLQKATKQ